jgi:four helix bundle protein
MRFEDLEIYQLSEKLADEIWDIVRGWDVFCRDTVGRQIVRAADSIGANIAEGVGRGSFQDNRRMGRIARGSLNETKHWLRRSFKRELLTKDQVDKVKPILDKLAPKLNAYLSAMSRLAAQDRATSGRRTLNTKNNEPRTKN